MSVVPEHLTSQQQAQLQSILEQMAFAETLQTALWIFDIAEKRMVWANPAAVQLWHADSLEQLLGRDFAADISSATEIRLENYLSLFREGQTVTESWTFFPQDRPVTVMCRCSGYPLLDGRLAMLVEGTAMDAVEAPTLRAIEALRHTSVLISVYDAAGRLLFRNPEAERVLGAAGNLLEHFIQGEDRDCVFEALQHDNSCTVEAEVHTLAGPRLHQLDIRRTPDPESGETMQVVSETDVTDTHSALEAVYESEQTLHEITDVLADGVYVMDREGRITFCNPSAAKMLGWPQDALIGKNSHSTFHHTREGGEPYPPDECPVIRTVRQGVAFRSFHEHFIRADGTMFPVALVAAPILRHGKVVAAVTAFHDISRQQAVEEALREKEQSLSRAQQIARLGSWDWDVRSGEIRWSDEVYRIFGYRPSQFEPTYERFLDRVHPDDLAELQTAVDEALEGRGSYQLEHRILRSDGKQRVVSERGEAQFDEASQALHMSGTVQDITERKDAEHALEATQQRLTALISSLRGAVLVEDEQRDIVLVNQAFCDIFQIPLPPGQLIGMGCANAAEQAKHLFLEPERFVSRITEILAQRETVIAEEWTMVDGRVFERDYVPIFIGEEYRGHLWQYWDVTERKRAEAELRRHATTDALTGLLNRRTLLEAVERELSRFRRNAAAAAILMVDVDHFKQINDTYGHAAGDKALIALAKTMESVTREVDSVGRLGGEEFLLLLPDTSAAEAKVVAERLRQRVQEQHFGDSARAFSFSVSIGVTCFAEATDTVSTLLTRADEALYRAKAEGRNRVVFS